MKHNSKGHLKTHSEEKQYECEESFDDTHWRKSFYVSFLRKRLIVLSIEIRIKCNEMLK